MGRLANEADRRRFLQQQEPKTLPPVCTPAPHGFLLRRAWKMRAVSQFQFSCSDAADSSYMPPRFQACDVLPAL